MEPAEYLNQISEESISIHRQLMSDFQEQIITAAQELGACVSNGGKILICGNGGSAADSQHFAAEMIGRLMLERGPLPAIALTTDSSNLTAVANDYSYDVVFSRQVEALAKPEDVLVAISTSGNSSNVVKAVEAAKKIGTKVIGLTGRGGGELKDKVDLLIDASAAKDSNRTQESHIFVIHSMIDLLDRFYLKR